MPKARWRIVLGHDDVAGYEETRGFLGVTVGRYANRIAGGRFTLDSVAHAVERNDGPNSLHVSSIGVSGSNRWIW